MKLFVFSVKGKFKHGTVTILAETELKAKEIFENANDNGDGTSEEYKILRIDKLNINIAQIVSYDVNYDYNEFL